MSIKYDAALIHAAFEQIANRKFKDDAEFLHTCRMELEPYIFGTLNHRYGAEFQKYWDNSVIPNNMNKSVVIVERRCHPNLRFCLQNAAYYARGWAITADCSDANMAYVKA